MDPTRVFLWFVGVVLVLGALVLLFVETGLSRWVPYSVFGAGLLLLLGVMVLSLSRSGGRPTEEKEGDVRVTKVE